MPSISKEKSQEELICVDFSSSNSPSISEEEDFLPDKNFSSEIVHHEILRAVEIYSQEVTRSKQKYTTIHVDEIVSSLAKSYEKIRKVIDWKDDNALRRGAIERILKRILFPKMVGFSFKNHDVQRLAKIVTLELIRGGHLANHVIPQNRIELVAIALNKYLFFWNNIFSNEKGLDVKKKTNIATFVLEIAACEIEEILANPVKEEVIVEAMAKILAERISVIPSDSISPREKFELIMISVQRKLYNLDDKYIVYYLLKSKNLNWFNLSKEEMKEVADELLDIHDSIYESINTSVNRKFDEVAGQVNTVFVLFDDILEKFRENPDRIKSVLQDKEEFTKFITEFYDSRKKTLKTRLINLAIFSTLSVFLCNWAAFYILEVPLANLLYGGFSTLAIVVDLLLPTFIVFILVAFIKPPREGNFERVISTALSFVYKNEGKEDYVVDVSKKDSSVFDFLMTLIYIFTAVKIFGAIAYIFHLAQLPLTSVIYNTLTIPIAVFAAVAIRKQAKELNVGEDSNLQDFLLDVITVPVAKVGSIFAKKWKEYNVFSVFFNFIIEIPLVGMFDFIQGWNKYISEKKSELR